MKINKIKDGTIGGLDIKRNNREFNFTNNLNVLKKNKTIEELEANIKNIKSIGARLILTKNYVDVTRYKKAIQDYFKSIVDNMYNMDKSKSFWEDKYFNTVKVVNKKLEELSDKLINEQKENLNIVSDIDTIQGLLIDLYI